MGHIVKEWTMDKKDFNYREKLYWAKKWNRSTNKILVRIKFTNKYPKRYNVLTWYGRTIARNILAQWAKEYNLGTLEPKIQRGNWVPKKKRLISDLNENDQKNYQEIVEDIFKKHNISKDEISKRIQERKNKIKNKKSMCESFNLSRKILYQKIIKKPTRKKALRNWFFIIVEQVYLESNQIYGYKKNFKQLINEQLTYRFDMFV